MRDFVARLVTDRSGEVALDGRPDGGGHGVEVGRCQGLDPAHVAHERQADELRARQRCPQLGVGTPRAVASGPKTSFTSRRRTSSAACSFDTIERSMAMKIGRLAGSSHTVRKPITTCSPSVGSVRKPAGFENSQGILSAAYAKDGADSQWDNDPGMKKFYAFLEKYYPEGNKLDGSVVYGYGAAQTLVKVLQMCGDDLTRANVMKQAASLKDFTPDTLLPGVKINTSDTDFAPIEQLQMMRFKGEKWDLFGDTISGEINN